MSFDSLGPCGLIMGGSRGQEKEKRERERERETETEKERQKKRKEDRDRQIRQRGKGRENDATHHRGCQKLLGHPHLPRASLLSQNGFNPSTL